MDGIDCRVGVRSWIWRTPYELLMPNPSLASRAKHSCLPDADKTSDFDGRLLKYRQSGPMSPAIAIFHILRIARDVIDILIANADVLIGLCRLGTACSSRTSLVSMYSSK